MSCDKFAFPSHYLPLPILEVPCHVVNSSSHLITCHFPSWTSHFCGKFVFPSHYLPLPILGVPCHVVNSSSHLITCHFPSWTSHLLWSIRLPISLPATSRLGRPISCGKFVFPSHYLPLFILEVPCHAINSPSHLITCHFPSWTSHLLW